MKKLVVNPELNNLTFEPVPKPVKLTKEQELLEKYSKAQESYAKKWEERANKESVKFRLKEKVSKLYDNPKEDIVTQQIAEYLEILKTQGKVVCYSHVPQETFTRSWGTKMKNKRMGVRPGVPDMIVVLPSEEVLWIELKRKRGGTASPEQKAWIEALNWVGGSSHAQICKGFDSAKEFIDKFV